MSDVKDWEKLSNLKLAFEHQKAAFHRGDMNTVKEISAMFRERLEQKGYVHTYPFSWMYVDDLNEGLELGVICEEDGKFYAVAKERTVTSKEKVRGRAKQTEKTRYDISEFTEWFEGCKRREKTRSMSVADLQS